MNVVIQFYIHSFMSYSIRPVDTTNRFSFFLFSPLLQLRWKFLVFWLWYRWNIILLPFQSKPILFITQFTLLKAFFEKCNSVDSLQQRKKGQYCFLSPLKIQIRCWRYSVYPILNYVGEYSILDVCDRMDSVLQLLLEFGCLEWWRFCWWWNLWAILLLCNSRLLS